MHYPTKTIQILCRDVNLFYKLYDGPYDLQFNDYFTLSAQRRRTQVTPYYKVKKWKLKCTFTETTARLVEVFSTKLKQNSPTVKLCLKRSKSHLFHIVKNFSVKKTSAGSFFLNVRNVSAECVSLCT